MQYLLQYKGGTFIPEYLKGKKAQFDFPDAKIMRFRRNFPRMCKFTYYRREALLTLLTLFNTISLVPCLQNCGSKQYSAIPI